MNRPELTMSAEQILTMRRKGSFVVKHTGSNANQCGMKGTTILHYMVSVVTKGYRLNQQGFIMDNGEVQKYFDTKYKSVKEFPSCEQMAQTACEDIRAKFGKNTGNASKLYGICVIVSGMAGVAELECAWVAPGYESNTQILMAMRPIISI